MFRVFLIATLLVLPGLAQAQDKTAGTSEKKLAELESKLQALLKEIQALRGSKTAPAKTEEKVEVRVRIPEIEKLADLKLLKDKMLEVKPKIASLTDAKDRIRIALQEKSEMPKVVTGTPGAAAMKWYSDGQQFAWSSDGKGMFSLGSSDPNTVHLTRVTYTLNAGQAKVVDQFLKDHAKAKVLETSVDGDKLVVTTTPDVQQTIGQLLVGLITGKPARVMFYQGTPLQGLKGVPSVPAVPGVPAVPKVVVGGKTPAAIEIPKVPQPPAPPKVPAKPAEAKKPAKPAESSTPAEKKPAETPTAPKKAKPKKPVKV